MNFKSIVESFTGSTNIGYYMIHLPRSTERIPVINELQYKLNASIPLFDAADGVELVKAGHPQRCGHSIGTVASRSPGDIGCTVSHVNIARDCLAKGYEYAVVFEDDCEFNKTLEELSTILDIAKGNQWDLFLLGASAYLDHKPINNSLSTVKSFYGTHSLIMNKTFMENLICIYTSACEKGLVYAADGLYSIVCKETDIKAVGFRGHNLYFKQRAGMYSYILNRVRDH